MLPSEAIDQIMNDLDMETAARWAGLSLDPPKYRYRCDTCKNQMVTAAKPEDIIGTACRFCDGGSYELEKDYQDFDATKYTEKW